MEEITTLEHELPFQEFDDERLVALLSNINKTIVILESENLIFEKHQARVTAHLQSSASAASKRHQPNPNELEKEGDDAALLEIKKRKKKLEKKDGNATSTLSMEQKLDISTREVDEMKDFIENQKKEWAKVMDNCKAELECADMTLAELKKELFEFKRDIGVGAVDPRTKKIVAEKLLRYYEESIRAKVY